MPFGNDLTTGIPPPGSRMLGGVDSTQLSGCIPFPPKEPEGLKTLPPKALPSSRTMSLQNLPSQTYLAEGCGGSHCADLA